MERSRPDTNPSRKLGCDHQRGTTLPYLLHSKCTVCTPAGIESVTSPERVEQPYVFVFEDVMVLDSRYACPSRTMRVLKKSMLLTLAERLRPWGRTWSAYENLRVHLRGKENLSCISFTMLHAFDEISERATDSGCVNQRYRWRLLTVRERPDTKPSRNDGLTLQEVTREPHFRHCNETTCVPAPSRVTTYPES